MGKSKYKRDWNKYDEKVITRYKLMFPFHLFDLLGEETKYKASNDFLAFLHAIEVRALEQLKITHKPTIWERVRNMNITLPETLPAFTGGQYIDTK